MSESDIINRLEHIIEVQRQRIQQLIAEVRAPQEKADDNSA